ncbi:hyaluronan and proteoglycan link protein 2 [Sardina pilchardus]|uniref:hyaluronan and proteoglycan link protein 2 n=1 Tax=Sardina pilchardus TaxID=27697 RepID=UPI002E15DE08
MGWAAVVVLTISLLTVNTVLCHTDEDKGQKTLKYLIEPPVYAEITVPRGGNATLPCFMHTKPPHYRIKWVKLEPQRQGVENIVLITNGHAQKHYGALGPRASLRGAHPLDASLRLANLELEDNGRYRCELINGIDDESVEVSLSIEGVVFPYQSRNGRYKFTFSQAQAACKEQDAILATHKQLYKAWTDGLDWCNAGWLSDGTVNYPILLPRPACGGELAAGIRSYGPRHKTKDHFDTFCFTSATSGSVFFVAGPLNFVEAERACRADQGELARVGQLYAAWRFQGLDRCDGGWLRDGSVRFPITAPRRHCGGLPEPGVRSFGYPGKTQKIYGAFCYR